MNKLDYELKMKELEDNAEEILDKILGIESPSLHMLGRNNKSKKSKRKECSM